MTKVETPIDLPTHSSSLAARQQSVWREFDPKAAADWQESWPRWQKKLAKQPGKPLAALLGAKKSDPLLWGLPEKLTVGDLPDLTWHLAKVGQGKKKAGVWAVEALLNWLDEAGGTMLSLGYAVECIAWCHASRELAAHLPAGAWLELMARLISMCDDAAGLDLQREPLLHQLLAGELAIALGYTFPKVASMRSRAAHGRKAIAAGLLELLDGEGMPRAADLGQFRPWMACWVRSAAMCRALGEPLLIDETDDAFAWAFQQMLRLTVGGRQLLDGERHSLPSEMVQAALATTSDPECHAIASYCGHLGKKKTARYSKLRAPQAGAESEWSEVGLLRSDWTDNAATLLTLHTGRELQQELSIGGEVVFRGIVSPQVEIDGRVLAPEQDWEQVCWQSDDDTDYLELEIQLEGGWRLQRQMMLARKDCFVLLADALLCPAGDTQPHDIAYRCRYPLAADLTFHASEETADGLLGDEAGQARALVLPLALPEWRIGMHRGKLQADDAGGLVLQQHHRGLRLFAPLFFDIYPRRMRKQLTWRQLTVAEHLQIQSADVAVGYRIQIGMEQWLVYRSLDGPGNRTVLGHNLISEYLVARFDDGEAQALLEVE